MGSTQILKTVWYFIHNQLSLCLANTNMFTHPVVSVTSVQHKQYNTRIRYKFITIERECLTFSIPYINFLHNISSTHCERRMMTSVRSILS